MPEINSRTDFFQVLGETLTQARTLQQGPAGGFYKQFEVELVAMQEWTANGRTPTLEERKRITIGLIASREIEPTKNIELYEFCQRLYQLNYYFAYWPSDPNSPVSKNALLRPPS